MKFCCCDIRIFSSFTSNYEMFTIYNIKTVLNQGGGMHIKSVTPTLSQMKKKVLIKRYRAKIKTAKWDEIVQVYMNVESKSDTCILMH